MVPDTLDGCSPAECSAGLSAFCAVFPLHDNTCNVTVQRSRRAPGRVTVGNAVTTATISNALFRLGHKDRTIAAQIKPVAPATRVAGPAATAKAYPDGTNV